MNGFIEMFGATEMLGFVDSVDHPVTDGFVDTLGAVETDDAADINEFADTLRAVEILGFVDVNDHHVTGEFADTWRCRDTRLGRYAWSCRN